MNSVRRVVAVLPDGLVRICKPAGVETRPLDEWFSREGPGSWRPDSRHAVSPRRPLSFSSALSTRGPSSRKPQPLVLWGHQIWTWAVASRGPSPEQGCREFTPKAAGPSSPPGRRGRARVWGPRPSASSQAEALLSLTDGYVDSIKDGH